MHILIGNTVSNNQPHEHISFNLIVANTNGLTVKGRWEQILSRCNDFTALVETHCTEHMQKSLPFVAKDFHILWGAPIKQGARTGVAALVKKGCCWNTKIVSLTNSPCEKYFNIGRLLLVQLFYGKGNRSILIYIVYGQAGSRWEQSKKDELESMIAAITHDMNGRGSIPALIVGDFNIQISESNLLQKLLFTKQWYDANCLGSADEKVKNTSHKNSGSRIDFVFANTMAVGLLKTYQVVPGVLPDDHSEVHVTISLPRSTQVRYVISQPNQHLSTPYDEIPHEYVPPTIDSIAAVSKHLQKNNIDCAFQSWCSLAQEWLCKIPHTSGTSVQFDSGKHRGQVRFQKQCAFPRQTHAHTLNLHSRRIACALGRVQELQKIVTHGTQSQNTWKNLRKVIPSLKPEDRASFIKYIDQHISVSSLEFCEHILRQNLIHSQYLDHKSRIAAWKQKLAQSEKHAYKWLKSPDSPEDIAMKLPDGTYTANSDQQLAAIHQNWLPIFQKFAHELPDVKTFEEHFVPFMKASPMHLEPLTGPQLVSALSKSKHSAPSLDGWTPQSLIALSKWFPTLFDGLACIFNWIEEHSIWPSTLCQAYTSLIPKSGMSESPTPLEHRPISVLSAVYRLWAKTRFGQSLDWQEHWCPNEVWGCRPKRGAEALCLQIALHLEQTAVDQQSAAGGIAYDFRKAFDLVPYQLLFSALAARGMHHRIINPLRAMYSSLYRVFKLRGSCGPWWTANNGLLQGCPLSMIGLNAVVSSILEIAKVQCPEVIARTYADDVSATCVTSSTQALVHNIAKFHRIVYALEEIKFGEIATDKSFTFGHPCLKQRIQPDYKHLQNFKIVGGSFISEGQNSNASAVERGRFATWHATVCKMRYCPLPWRDKAKMMVATSSQATFGQGTHSPGMDEPALTKIRSNIIRAMFSLDFYSLNPHLTFAILLPPQVDPLFCHIYQGLRTLARCLTNDTFRHDFQLLLRARPSKNFDGPVNRVRKLLKGPFQELVLSLLNDDSLNLELWAHQLRDSWRHELLKRAAKNRPQHFHDVHNLDFRRTMMLYKELDEKALRTADENVFMQQGVLRRLLVGGLLTEESDSRHRKDANPIKCPCGQDPTVLHISWICPLFSVIREPIAHIDFQALPTCTQYAALIPSNLDMSDQQIKLLQLTLVSIWQAYIRDYKSGKRNEPSQQVENTDIPVVDQNGHMLKPRLNSQPGVWCCKCGKYVARSKHIRLKITGQPGPQRNSTVILTQEGFHQSEKRLDDAFEKLQNDYNAKSKHTLTWNRKLGKVVGRDDEGKIDCTVCGRSWKWKDRANMRNTVCKPISKPEASASIGSASEAVRPTVRLRQKTKPQNALPTFTSSNLEHPSSSSSSLQPPGLSNADVVRRRGIG